jgi:hypothetical protein
MVVAVGSELQCGFDTLLSEYRRLLQRAPYRRDCGTPILWDYSIEVGTARLGSM